MLRYLLLLFLLCPTVVFSKIETKTVEVNGIASDESSAINSALVEAISQINGAKIAAEVKTSLSQVTTKDGADVKKTFDKNVSKITNGLVKSYQILSSEKEENLFKVRLSVQVSKFKKSVQTKTPYLVPRAKPSYFEPGGASGGPHDFLGGGGLIMSLSNCTYKWT